MGIPRDFDIGAHNARVAAWKRDEAKRSDVLRENKKLLQVAAPPAASPKADAPHKGDAASRAPIYPLVGLCRAAGLPEPIPEYKFHHARRWRADYCWPIHKVIVEVEGGVWTEGRHTRGSGFVKDMEKYNAAALLGFYVLRYTPQQLGQAVGDLRVMFAR